MGKKAFASGCFDLLHSGHVAFLQQAAAYGDLYVAIGSDRTIFELKGRPALTTEDERLFMIKSLSCVTDAMIARGSGMLDFADELRRVQPDVFVVNEDGNTPAKQQLCASLGIEYVVLKREPHAELPARSTTALRQIARMPYRIDLAGGWLDQPFVSQHHPGAVLTISIEPTVEFNERSGMASSTRRSALDLWGPGLPVGEHAKLAKVLFCYDNPPGTTEVSGAQDAIGIVFPGLARSYYQGQYWPTSIESAQDEAILRMIEQSLFLVPLGPRSMGYNPLNETVITSERAKALADAADACWQALHNHDRVAFGRAMRAAFEAQIAMFPHMVNPMITELIETYAPVAEGWKISGAGGGGYLILVAGKPIPDAMQIKIRRAAS
jgi:cytidyltransferase-like protein